MFLKIKNVVSYRLDFESTFKNFIIMLRDSIQITHNFNKL